MSVQKLQKFGDNLSIRISGKKTVHAYKQYSQMTWPHSNYMHPILYIKNALTSGELASIHLVSRYPQSADALSSSCFCSSSLYSETSNILIKATVMVANFLEKLPCTLLFAAGLAHQDKLTCNGGQFSGGIMELADGAAGCARGKGMSGSQEYGRQQHVGSTAKAMCAVFHGMQVATSRAVSPPR